MAKIHEAKYEGIHMRKLKTLKKRIAKSTHPIFLYDRSKDSDQYQHLDQVVKVYKHTIYDFEANSRAIIDHYKKHIGDPETCHHSLGVMITFQVTPNGKTYDLPLFRFLMNYSMLIAPVIMGVDLSDWNPWTPRHWSDDAWITEMDKHIKECRPYANMRGICECLEMSKYLINLWVAKVGHFLGLTISNTKFVESMERSDYIRDTIMCRYPFHENPTMREKEIVTRTKEVLRLMSEQTDSPLSVYTRLGLFNAKQFGELAVGIGNKPDLYGNTIPYSDHTNVFMGLRSALANMVDSRGGRKAEALKENVADAGALQRSLSMLMSSMRYVDSEYECDSDKFRTRTIDSVDTLFKLEGRVMICDGELDEDGNQVYAIIDPELDLDLIGTTVKIKTPITCTHPQRENGVICAGCYGILMANLNRDIHVGRLAALNSSDEFEQKLLSAKHALTANTLELGFPKVFDEYFTLDSYHINFKEDVIALYLKEASEGTWAQTSSLTKDLKNTFIEFYPDTMTKNSDGEGRAFDRGMAEIVLYNKSADTRVSIVEDHSSIIYLSPEMATEHFLPCIRTIGDDTAIAISLYELLEAGTHNIFDCRFTNQEMSAGLMKLKGILTKNVSIQQFTSFNDLLDTIIPLFRQGGIHLPDLQAEMLVSQLIWSEEGKPIDWTEEDPVYTFMSVDKSIQHNPACVTSILHHDPKSQLAGKYGTYEKTGTSGYDYFLLPEDAGASSK